MVAKVIKGNGGHTHFDVPIKFRFILISKPVLGTCLRVTLLGLHTIKIIFVPMFYIQYHHFNSERYNVYMKL